MISPFTEASGFMNCGPKQSVLDNVSLAEIIEKKNDLQCNILSNTKVSCIYFLKKSRRLSQVLANVAVRLNREREPGFVFQAH